MKSLILLLCMVFASNSFAFVRTGVDKINSPKTLENKAKAENLGISREERTLKNEIVATKKKDAKKFEALTQDPLANPAYYQSFLLEVRDGLSQVEKAKVLAKFTILNQIRQNKDFMFKSIINKHAATTWDEAEYYIKRDINDSTVYVPTKSSTEYQFESGDWGRVRIAKDLKTAKWHLDVASRFDGNKLEPTAKDIIIDSEGGSGGGGSGFEQEHMLPSQPIAAPILGQIDKKSTLEKASLKPKLKK